MIENNDIEHVNLFHVFNAVILYFTITDLFEGRSHLSRWGMAVNQGRPALFQVNMLITRMYL